MNVFAPPARRNAEPEAEAEARPPRIRQHRLFKIRMASSPNIDASTTRETTRDDERVGSGEHPSRGGRRRPKPEAERLAEATVHIRRQHRLFKMTSPFQRSGRRRRPASTVRDDERVRRTFVACRVSRGWSRRPRRARFGAERSCVRRGPPPRERDLRDARAMFGSEPTSVRWRTASAESAKSRRMACTVRRRTIVRPKGHPPA
jgi:hypothetical protein